MERTSQARPTRTRRQSSTATASPSPSPPPSPLSSSLSRRWQLFAVIGVFAIIVLFCIVVSFTISNYINIHSKSDLRARVDALGAIQTGKITADSIGPRGTRLKLTGVSNIDVLHTTAIDTDALVAKSIDTRLGPVSAGYITASGININNGSFRCGTVLAASLDVSNGLVRAGALTVRSLVVSQGLDTGELKCTSVDAASGDIRTTGDVIGRNIREMENRMVSMTELGSNTVTFTKPFSLLPIVSGTMFMEEEPTPLLPDSVGHNSFVVTNTVGRNDDSKLGSNNIRAIVEALPGTLLAFVPSSTVPTTMNILQGDVGMGNFLFTNSIVFATNIVAINAIVSSVVNDILSNVLLIVLTQDGNVVSTFSTDLGLTWSPPVNVISDATLQVIDALYTDYTDEIKVTVASPTTGVYVITSIDHGLNWLSPVVVLSAYDRPPLSIVDIRLAFIQELVGLAISTEDASIYCAYTLDNTTWSNVTVSSAGVGTLGAVHVRVIDNARLMLYARDNNSLVQYMIDVTKTPARVFLPTRIIDLDVVFQPSRMQLMTRRDVIVIAYSNYILKGSTNSFISFWQHVIVPQSLEPPDAVISALLRQSHTVSDTEVIFTFGNTYRRAIEYGLRMDSAVNFLAISPPVLV
jgi:large-conductance mechanosensitive channel